jgi:hypothetical protein
MGGGWRISFGDGTNGVGRTIIGGGGTGTIIGVIGVRVSIGRIAVIAARFACSGAFEPTKRNVDVANARDGVKCGETV